MRHLRILSVFAWIMGTYGYDDLSRLKNTTQSATSICTDCSDISYDASMAVDNKLETCTRTLQTGDQWWMVDLGETKSIVAIVFSFKEYKKIYHERQQNRLSGYSIYVSNSNKIKSGELCFKHNGTYLPKLNGEHTCASFGRYIQFCNKENFIELCNFTVLGCRSGFFGVRCDLECSKQCKNNQCYAASGTCLGCTDGWTGSSCDQKCASGMYGHDCKTPCSGHCRNNVICNHINGTCASGCTDGWMDNLCEKECANWTFGRDCKNSCGHYMNDQPCNKTTGKCEMGCNSGFQGELCNKECDIGSFGQNCSEKCSSLCRNSDCHNINGNCKKGCIDGYQGQKCEKTCEKLWYGQNCSMKCSVNCINKSCDHITGNCDHGCEQGWQKPTCSEMCTPETFGRGCSKKCSGNCKTEQPCNHMTGICTNGCIDGFNGLLCDSICVKGFYGENCSHACPQNCSGTCHHIHGYCDCKPGIKGSPECIRATTTTTRDSSLTVGLSVGTSIILIIFLVSLTLCLRYRKKIHVEKESLETQKMTMLQTFGNSKSSTKSNASIGVESSIKSIDHMHVHDKDPRGGLTHMKKIIPIKNLQGIIEKLTFCESAGFKNEYTMIIPALFFQRRYRTDRIT